MDQTKEEEKVNGVVKEMIKIIETKSYNKQQLFDFKNLIKKVYDIQNTDLLRTCYKKRRVDLIYLICRHKKKKLLKFILHESHILHYFVGENSELDIEYKEDTLFYAMCLNQFKVIELLYDHWTGNLHWSGHKMEYNDVDVDKLNQLNNLMEVALERYEDWSLSQVTKNIDQTMLFNMQSLIALNNFQRDLYTKLNELKKGLIASDGKSVDEIRISETEAIRNMILAMFDCYEEHTDKLGDIIQKSVYEHSNEYSELSELFEIPKDTSELQRKAYLYVFYNVYFRKLDYNICLLILDNLHSLKLRLQLPEDSYQKLENKVYQFIYHLSNNWSLYIPKRKNIKVKEFLGQYNGTNCNFSLKYNEDTFQKGLNIIYLEKIDFENALYDFKKQLRNMNIKENIRKVKIKLPNQETNSLTLLPELRDIYSLTRIAQHIKLFSEEINYTKKYVTLLVERALQIVGEFLKSTNETLHLQPTTEALIEVEISVDIVNDLKHLRDLLCHVKDGEILKKIIIEENDDDVFDVILLELKSIKKKIDKVIMICKPLVQKSLILYALSLIEKRRKSMPEEVANYWFALIKWVRLIPQNQPYCELFEAPIGYVEEYSTEAIMLVEHSLQLDSKLRIATAHIRNNLIRNVSTYKDLINNSLQKICKVKMNWQQIVTGLKNEISLSDFPNEKDANKITSYSKVVNLSDDLHCLIQDNNNNFAYAEIHFKFIKKLLQFIILKTGAINCSQDELDNITRKLKTLSCNDTDMEKVVTTYLLMIEKKLNTNLITKHRNQCLEFNGVKELRRKLTVTNFLNQSEKKYLTYKLKYNINTSNIKLTTKIEKMIRKINDDVAIPKNEYTNFITKINLDQKAQKILMNLVMGYKRDPLHPFCLSNRISMLREITKNQSVDHLITRCKLEKNFRALLEVLLFDIFAILDCTKNHEIIKKSSKFLKEINLRNYLIHGSPLLETVGNVLDSNDWPTELISKTFELVKEERFINAQCALIELDFDFTQINSKSLCPEERALVIEFKKSTRWKDYLKFIPELNRKKQKEIAEVDKNLLDAVKQKDSDLVQKRIDEGGNVNYVDNSKRALIHHAAIKGCVDVIKILINNGADVNVPCKYNMTALHYSAMNGFVDAVELLLKNGANYFALDDRGRSAVYLTYQRNHLHVCRVLVQAMKNDINQYETSALL